MISIVIPIYNSEEYLSECLESIINQTYSDIEILCIDDGSTDNSKEICLNYLYRDKRFKYIFQENGGVSKARNTGLHYAKGDFLCFIDSDDIIDINYLSNLINKIDRYDLVICDYTRDSRQLGDNNGKQYEYASISYINDIIFERIKHPNICMMLFRAEIIHQNSLIFTEGCVRKEDAEFYLKYMSCCNMILWIDYIGYFYRDNMSSAMHNYNLKSLTGINAALRIKEYLVDKNIINNECMYVEACLQEFVYHLSRSSNKNLYNLLHSKFEITSVMRNILKFPRISRRFVAIIYLIVGKNLFYKIFSKFFPE